MDAVKRLVLPVNKADYPDAVNVPSYPGLVLTAHVVTRTAMVGSIASYLVAPVVWWQQPKPRRSFLRAVWPKTCLRGTVAGAVLGVGLTVGRVAMDDSEYGVVDRAYRLSNNHMQLLTDKFVYSGAGVMGVVGVWAFNTGSRFFAAARGSAVGLSLGLAAMVACRAFDPESTVWGPDEE